MIVNYKLFLIYNYKMVSNTAIIVGVLIIVIVVVIIVAVVANHGNELNVYADLPNYHIINTTDNSYIGLTNYGIPPCHTLTRAECSTTFCNNCAFNIPDPFWGALATSGYDVDKSMDIWQLDEVTPIPVSFTGHLQSNQKLVKVINSIYNEQSPQGDSDTAGLGFLVKNFNFDITIPKVYLQPTGSVNSSNVATFIFTQMSNNTFTLQDSTGELPYVYVEPTTNNLTILFTDTTTKTVFKLVPRIL